MAPKAADKKAAAVPAATPEKKEKKAPEARVGHEWWLDDSHVSTKRGDRRWESLSHNGVVFPDAYVPHGVPILYDGKTFKMTSEEEEVATMFGKMRTSEFYRKPDFRKNFFDAFRVILDKRGKDNHPIRKLELVDFDAIWKWEEARAATAKARTSAEKKATKEALEAKHEPFKFCIWNGHKEKTAQFVVEPPGLFRGRGDHPAMGKLKRRVEPEDITINIGEGEAVPAPPAGRRWKEVVHDHSVTWLCNWVDEVMGNKKYVMLAASGAIKGAADRDKFERARLLHKSIDKIRADYHAGFHSPILATRQLSVCVYFIDKLALRVGGEKDGAEEADTVGAASLCAGHITCRDGNLLYFDFLGKDSVPYQNEVEVEPKVWELIGQWVKEAPKHTNEKGHDFIFWEVQPVVINRHLQQYQSDLTAKVFRTYNASKCLQDVFEKTPVDSKLTVTQKMVYFNKANTDVAVLCNHQKGVSKNHGQAMYALDTKGKNANAAVDLIKECMAIESKKGWDAAQAHYYGVQEKEQWEWLNEHGTDEDKAKFQAEVDGRNSKAAASPRKAATPAKKAATPAKKAATPAKRGRGKAAESDSEDECLADVVLSRAAAAKKGASPPKKAAKKETPAAKSPAKKPAAKAAAKSPAKKPAAKAAKAPAKKPAAKAAPKPAAKKGGKK